jgi:membrane protease YdiL (CAAX protease family)
MSPNPPPDPVGPGYPNGPGYPVAPGFPGGPGYAVGPGYPGGPSYSGGPSYPVPPVPGDDWMGFDGGRRPHWGMGDVVIGLLVWLVATFATFEVFALAGAGNGLTNIVGLFGSWIGMVGYLLAISRWKGLGSFRRDFGFRFELVDVPIGVAAGLATLIASSVVITFVANLFDSEAEGNAAKIFAGQGDNRVGLVVMALMATFGAPFVEELFFRGLTLRAIERRFGGGIGVVGSASLFALLHWQTGTVGASLSLVAGIFVFGAVFAMLARWLRRLGPSIVAHMTLNGISSALLIYGIFTGATVL